MIMETVGRAVIAPARTVEPRPVGDWRELDDGFSEWADMLVWAVTAIAAVGLVAFIVGVASAIFKL